MMRREVYEKVAEVLAMSRSVGELSDIGLKSMIFRFQVMFGKDNERFDPKKFSDAVYGRIEKAKASHGF